MTDPTRRMSETQDQVRADLFRDVLGHFATGVTIVTALEAGEPAGFTCQAFLSLSLEHRLVALAPSKGSTSWPRIARAGRFCVNVLASNQAELCRVFAVSGADKFRGVSWDLTGNGSVRLAGALAWVDCEIELVHEAGDHELIVGRVVDLAKHPERNPLLFYRGGFGSFVGAGTAGSGEA
jgi:3-hydroxy-9,10-secoandrosta-1,3,5(10)-triene-9,17-dione monooxygenase reductase component